MTTDGWSRNSVHELWRKHVNPDYVQLLEMLDFGQRYVWAQGTKLRNDEGREFVDFLAGFGVHNVGHNHPRLVRALCQAVQSGEPSMLNVDAPLAAGLLAEKLQSMTHPALCRVAFASSGAEAVEAAVKACRAATGRRLLLACDGGYHGLTAGAITLMGSEEHRQAFAPSVADVLHLPFGDASALEHACRQHRPAGLFVEPIQGEGGMRVPPDGYLREAAAICRKAGCLLVIDEIQTGLGRTGRDFATNINEVVPDVLLAGKALSGGMVPVAAAMMTSPVWSQAFGGPARCNACISTFSANRLAMAAGLETLRILEDESLAAKAEELGGVLLGGLRRLAAKHSCIVDVRGRGLMLGVEFQPGSGLTAAVLPRWVREQLFAQVIAAVLLKDHGILTQTCGLAPNVLRIEPPLVITGEEIAQLLAALDATLDAYPTFLATLRAAVRKTVLGKEL